MPHRLSNLRIPLSDDARRALERSPLARAAADGALDAVELDGHDLSLDTLSGVGHENGQALTGDAGKALAARALALDPRTRFEQGPITAAERAELAARQREIARSLAAAGRSGEAFSALSTALLIDGVNPGVDVDPRLTPEQAAELGSLADLVASASLPAQLARRLATTREQLRLGGMAQSEIGLLLLALAGRRGDPQAAARGLVLVPELQAAIDREFPWGDTRYGSALVREIARQGAHEARPEQLLRAAHENTLAWSRALSAHPSVSRPPSGIGLRGMADAMLHGGPFIAAGLVEPEILSTLVTAVRFEQQQGASVATDLSARVAAMLAPVRRDAASQKLLAEAMIAVLQSRKLGGDEGLAWVQATLDAQVPASALPAAAGMLSAARDAGVADERTAAFMRAAFGGRAETYPGVYDVIARMANRAARAPEATTQDVADAAATLGRLFAAAGETAGAFFALDLLDRLELPARVLHLERLGPALAKRLNELENPAEATGDWSDAASLINALHDAEGALTRSDRIRETFIATLTPASALRLVTHGGHALYTSSFLGAWRALRERLGEKKLGAFLDEQFPLRAAGTRDEPSEQESEHRAIRAGLLRTIGRFGLDDAFADAEQQLRPFVVREIAGEGDSEPDDAVGAAARYTRYFVRAFDGLPAAERAAIEEKLVSSVRGELGGLEMRGAHAFVLKALHDAEASLGAEAAVIAAALPPPDDQAPPIDAWLADGKLVARLFFYDDEPWFEDTVRFYRRRGFSPVDRAPITPQTREVVLERETAAGTQRLVFTREEASGGAASREAREAMLRDANIDIVVHRGHSYHFHKTFPTDLDAHASHPKLLIGGSCGSYGEMSSGRFLATYGQHRLIADTNTGEGAVNNQLLLTVLDAVAAGAKTWEAMQLGTVAEQRGLVLPNDPAFTVSSYIHELTRRDAANRKRALIPNDRR